jgi:hypothetical protein
VVFAAGPSGDASTIGFRGFDDAPVGISLEGLFAERV